MRKVLSVTSLLFGLMILYCFIGWKLGYDGLFLVGEVQLPNIAAGLIGTALFQLQIFLIFGFVLNLYTKEVFKYYVPYAVLHSLINLFYSSFITSTVLPIAVLLLLSAYQKNLKQGWLRTLIVFGSVAVYQVSTIIIRVGYASLGHSTLTLYARLICSIDLLLIIFLIYVVGGERYYVGSRLEHFVLPEDVNVIAQDSEDDLARKDFAKLRGFQRAKAVSLLLAFQGLQWALIVFLCHLGNVFVEGLIVTTSFVAHGFIIRKRWHSKSLIVCTLSSAGLFYIAAKFTLSFYYSQLFPIVVGLILIYSMYRLAVFLDKQNIQRTETELARLKQLEREMQVAWAYVDKMDTD